MKITFPSGLQVMFVRYSMSEPGAFTYTFLNIMF